MRTKRSAIIQKALAVFETRSLGVTKLRYAHYSGSSWSDAQFIPSDTVQTSSPSVTNLGVDTSNVFLLPIGSIMKFSPKIRERNLGRRISDLTFRYKQKLLFPKLSATALILISAAHIAFNYDSSGIARIMYAIVTSVSLD
ncbi:MAG: hypothetical protein IPL67_02005 [Ignavibacteria bacterium]|nr:hypothetical protein [Ignavibacteria bacterium]